MLGGSFNGGNQFGMDLWVSNEVLMMQEKSAWQCRIAAAGARGVAPGELRTDHTVTRWYIAGALLKPPLMGHHTWRQLPGTESSTPWR